MVSAIPSPVSLVMFCCDAQNRDNSIIKSNTFSCEDTFLVKFYYIYNTVCIILPDEITCRELWWLKMPADNTAHSGFGLAYCRNPVRR